VRVGRRSPHFPAAVAVARELERRRPDLMTAAWWKEERGKRVFVDFNQNAPHKTVFGAWSVRARAGAQVSTPVAWDEISEIHPDQFTIASLPDRLASVGDTWAGMNDDPQTAAKRRRALQPYRLDDALRDPNQLSYLGVIVVPPGGGVRMEAAPGGTTITPR